MLLVAPQSHSAVRLAERTDLTALLLGPTGSGKTELARRLHDRSPRKDRPFVTVNLASIASGVFESELFGHERGAFTSAIQSKVGKIVKAEAGTLFLDEIGELPLPLQARLLEFIQHRTYSSVGGNHQKTLNVRIIAATNQNLEAAVERGQFRKDLFHRLRVLQIEFLSLQDLADDFGPLLHSVLERVCATRSRSVHRISEEAALALERYSWPGNLRELFHVLECAVEQVSSGSLELEHLPSWLVLSVNRLILPDVLDAPDTYGREAFDLWIDYEKTMKTVEESLLRRALRSSNGKVEPTARALGMSKSTLIRRLNALGLRKNKTK